MQNESDKTKRKIALTLEDARGDVTQLGTIADFLFDPRLKLVLVGESGPCRTWEDHHFETEDFGLRCKLCGLFCASVTLPWGNGVRR